MKIAPVEPAYHKIPWKVQDKVVRSPLWKRAFYRFLRPWLSVWTRRYLEESTLNALHPSWVLPERGFPLEARRRWASKGQPLHGKTILVQGTGTGWDVITWAELKPARIFATDLFSFEDTWQEITATCKQQYGVEVIFQQAPMEDHGFLPDESIDLCASDAVFEHCKDMPRVMRECYRILKSTGSIYATYGPMWFCASGDHFGRGGLENVYNHILLPPEDYQAYFRQYRKTEEDFQSGGRYIELGLFSYLTTSAYLEIFQNAGFQKDEMILEISSQALQYAKQFPQKFSELLGKYPGQCTRDDFLIKANFIRLRKNIHR